MRISYSGIDLEVIELIDFERIPVFEDNQVDYLFTQVTITAVGLVSGDQVVAALRKGDETVGMSYVQDGTSGALVSGNAFNLGLPANVRKSPTRPIVTDKAIRHWLEIPRRRLVVTNHNTDFLEILLQSPKSGRVCDAHNGPIVEVYDIKQAIGDPRMMMVAFQVKTYINECEEADGRFGALLSNRFSQSQDIDADGFITVVTEGEAVFRTDLVYGQINPDVLRPYLFLPIPNGFQRVDINVVGKADASGFTYRTVDQQLPQQLVVGDEVNATRVEATYRQAALANEDALGTALNTIERHYSIAVNSLWAQDKGDSPKDPKKKKKKAKKKKRKKEEEGE